ncbi:hypothetical protein BX070DRAFT_35738 [Coemansia spiralis]|nr:hypothetical protein BX070DRAFT_35738 [Coemansia spiralis]
MRTRKRLDETPSCEDKLIMQLRSNVYKKNMKGLFTHEELDGLSGNYFDGRGAEKASGVLKYSVVSKSHDCCSLMGSVKNSETRECILHITIDAPRAFHWCKRLLCCV